MPIYEYQCRECGHEMEALQKMSDPALSDCPQCGQPALRKKISAAGFRLSGGGWYETDFKTGSKKNLRESGDASSGKGNNSGSSEAGKSAGGDKKTDKSAAAKPANGAN